MLQAADCAAPLGSCSTDSQRNRATGAACRAWAAAQSTEVVVVVVSIAMRMNMMSMTMMMMTMMMAMMIMAVAAKAAEVVVAVVVRVRVDVDVLESVVPLHPDSCIFDRDKSAVLAPVVVRSAKVVQLQLPAEFAAHWQQPPTTARRSLAAHLPVLQSTVVRSVVP